MALAWAALGLWTLSGCGPDAALWVRVEAPLVIPEACDAVDLTVTRLDGHVAFAETRDVSGLPRFPLTLMLANEVAANVSAQFEVRVVALKAGQRARPWAEAAATTTLERGKTTEVLLKLCDCTPTP